MVIRNAEGSDVAKIAALHIANQRTTYRGLLSDEYLDSLRVGDGERKWNEYLRQEGKPIFTIMLSLHQKTSDDLNVTPPFTEKDGVYWVDVNVDTGVIENILYDTQLGGNG